MASDLSKVAAVEESTNDEKGEDATTDVPSTVTGNEQPLQQLKIEGTSRFYVNTDAMMAAPDTGVPDETYRKDFEGKHVTAEEFEGFKMTTGEENEEAQAEE